MALFKIITYPQGFSASYWRVYGLTNVDIDKEVGYVMLAGYANYEIRNENPKNFIEIRTFEVPLTKEDLLNGTVYSKSYDTIKNTEEFRGAETL